MNYEFKVKLTVEEDSQPEVKVCHRQNRLKRGYLCGVDNFAPIRDNNNTPICQKSKVVCELTIQIQKSSKLSIFFKPNS